MFYILNNNYEFCGWNKLPFGLYNRSNGKTKFIEKEKYLFLLACDGKTFIDEDLLTKEETNVVEEFLKNKVIKRVKEKTSLDSNQNYKKYPSRFMQSVQWSITSKCNYKCKHCFMSASTESFELSTVECFKIIDQLVKCGIKNLSLTGGEPLVRKDIYKILDYINSKNIRITTIYTNGSLVTKELLNYLISKNQKPTFSISFDGVGEHDWLRGIKGAEEKAIEAFKLCKLYNFKTTSSMVLHRNNIHTIRDSVNFLSLLGVNGLKITRAYSIGQWESESPELKLTAKEVYDSFLEYIPYYKEDNYPLPIQLENFFACFSKGENYAIPGIRFPDNKKSLNKPVCGHIRTNFYISPEGYVLPCMPLANSVFAPKFPNLLMEDLSEILNDSVFMKAVDLRVKEYLKNNSDCNSCKFKLNCAGGCRGIALSEFNKNNSYFQKDKVSCEFFKNNYPEKIKSIMK